MIWLLLVPDSMEKKIKLQVYHERQLERSGRHEKSANIGVSCLIERPNWDLWIPILASPHHIPRWADSETWKRGLKEKAKTQDEAIREQVLSQLHCSALKLPIVSNFWGSYKQNSTICNSNIWDGQALQRVQFQILRSDQNTKNQSISFCWPIMPP